MQVNRMIHHGVIDHVDAQALAVLKADHVRFRPLLAVEPPDVLVHIASQVKIELSGWWTPICGCLQASELRIGENAPPIIPKPGARIAQLAIPRAPHHNTPRAVRVGSVLDLLRQSRCR